MRNVGYITLDPRPAAPVRALSETARRRAWLRSRTHETGREGEVSLRQDRESFAAELDRRLRS